MAVSTRPKGRPAVEIGAVLMCADATGRRFNPRSPRWVGSLQPSLAALQSGYGHLIALDVDDRLIAAEGMQRQLLGAADHGERAFTAPDGALGPVRGS